MPTSRLEAFSDGVFSIAITLLVLVLRSPHVDSGLATALAKQWPAYVTYLVSFLMIGIIWVNHHALFASIERTDRPLLFFNLILLMAVAAIPFPTALLSEYIDKGSQAQVAAVVYGGVNLVMALAFNLIWSYASRNRRCLNERLSDEEARALARAYRISFLIYLATLGIAFISAVASLIIYAALALFYVFDPIQVMKARRNAVRSPGDAERDSWLR
jgi:uncharacterized membrane protein